MTLTNGQVEAILDAATQVAIIATDTNGVITAFNTGAERMLGYSAQEMVGRHTPEVFHLPAEIAAHAERVSDAVAQPVAGFEVFVARARQGGFEEREWTYVRKDGSHVTVNLAVTAICSGSGEITGFLGVAADVTDRKRAEEALRQSEVNLRSLLYSMDDLVFVIGTDGTFRRYFQPLDRKDLYVPPEEFVGKHFRKVLPPHVAQLLQGAIERIEASGETQQFDYSLEVAGVESWFNAKLSPIKGPSHGSPEITAVVRDITARKRAEDAIRNSEERLELALSGANLVLWDYNPQTGKSFDDHAWATMLGYSMDEIGQMPRLWVTLVHPDDKARVHEKTRAVREGRMPSYEAEYRLRAKSGEWRWVLDRGKVVETDNVGKAVRMTGTHLDITDRKRAEQALRESEENYRTLVNNVNIGVYRNTAGPHGRFLQANPAVAKMFGHDSVEGFMKSSVSALYQNPDDRRWFIDEIERMGIVKDRELLLRKKDGTPIIASCTAKARYDRDGGIMWMDGVIEDVTERKRAEEALRQSEEKFRSKYENLPIPTFTWQKDGADFVLRDYNDAAVEVTGGEIADLVGRKVSELYQDVPEIRAEFARCLATRKPIKREMLYKCISIDEIRHLDVTYAFVPPDMVLVHTEDITRRKAAEAALKESERRFKALFDEARDAIFIADAETGLLVDVNRQAEKLTGRLREELIGMHQTKLHPPEESTNYRRYFAKHVRGGGGVDLPVEVLASDGRKVPMEVNASVIELADGKRLLQGIFRDITERKLAERKLQSSAAKLEQSNRELRAEKTRTELILQGIGEGVVVVDLDQRILVVNPVARELLAVEDNIAVGDQLERLFANCRISKEEMTKILTDEPLRRVAITVMQPVSRTLDMTCTLFQDELSRPAGRVFIFRDATREKEIDRMKSQIISAVSHELRTPLTSVTGFTATLLRDPHMPKETRNDFLEIIQEEADRLTGLIENILDISRIESGTVHLERTPVDVKGVVDKMIALLKPGIVKKQLILRCDIPPEPPQPVGDAGSIQTILVNLVGNAVKFTPTGGARDRARICGR